MGQSPITLQFLFVAKLSQTIFITLLVAVGRTTLNLGLFRGAHGGCGEAELSYPYRLC